MASFLIRSSTIRLVIFISTLIITTILILQLAWLRKVYRFEQKEFDHSVIKVIRGLYEDLAVSAYYSANLTELIEKPESQLYLAHITLPVNNDTLVTYLQYELEDFGIFTNCQFGVYSSVLKKYVYTDILTSTGVNEKIKAGLPEPPRLYDYVALYFPYRRQYIISQMNFLIISSAILLIVLLLFSTSLYYFYRQKFLNETQKDFIHNFAHEFKTPVTVISLAADVLTNKTIIEKPAKLANYAGIVKYQSNYLYIQTEKLLKFAYFESRQLHLNKEAIDIHQLINIAVNNLSPVIDEKNAELHYGLDADNPIVFADRNYILIVITNLIDNAVKYSKDPYISIITKNVNNSLELSINDNGIGIDKKQQKKLFQKFYRVRSGDTYITKGFGLGLTVVKKILKAHRGKIKIESSSGQGSTFIVELPLN